MKLEQSIQKRFINTITKQEEVSMPSEAIEVYTELVYYRFLEVFEKAYPRFKKMVSEETFDRLIYEFLKVGAKTPILWRVSGEFKAFLIEKNDLDMPYLADLLEFEFLEIEMFMQKYSDHTKSSFSLQKSYAFSKEANIRHFSYPVHHPDFDSNPEAFESGEFTILFYYNAKSEEVLYEEITPFIEEFLLSLTPNLSTMQSIEKIAEVYEIENEELLEILLPILEHFHGENILTL